MHQGIGQQISLIRQKTEDKKLTTATNTLRLVESYKTNTNCPLRSATTLSAGKGPRSRKVRYASIITITSVIFFARPYSCLNTGKLLKLPSNRQNIPSTAAKDLTTIPRPSHSPVDNNTIYLSISHKHTPWRQQSLLMVSVRQTTSLRKQDVKSLGCLGCKRIKDLQAWLPVIRSCARAAKLLWPISNGAVEHGQHLLCFCQRLVTFLVQANTCAEFIKLKQSVTHHFLFQVKQTKV